MVRVSDSVTFTGADGKIVTVADSFWDKRVETEVHMPSGRQGNQWKFQVGVKNGKSFINCREYYLDDSGELRPGKKGFSVPLSEAEEFGVAFGIMSDVAKSLAEESGK